MVRFELGDGTEWVGVFGNAEQATYHAAVPFPDDVTTALVIAGGQGYVVDARIGTLLRKTPWSYAYSAQDGTFCSWLTRPRSGQPIAIAT